MKLKGLSNKTSSFCLPDKDKDTSAFPPLLFFLMIAGDNSRFSQARPPQTHPELWFANDKWIANTIHELCSCHGDINQKTDSLGSEYCVCGIEMHDGSCTPSRLTERRAKRKQDIGSASHSEAYYECDATITRPQAHRQTASTEEKLKCEATQTAKPRASVCWLFFFF